MIRTREILYAFIIFILSVELIACGVDDGMDRNTISIESEQIEDDILDSEEQSNIDKNIKEESEETSPNVKFAKCETMEGTAAAITEDGKLYMWGRNSGKIDETELLHYSYQEPKLVMEHVADIKIGGFTVAAITEDGELYIWGMEFSLASDAKDGTAGSSCIKVMDNVKQIDICSGETIAAVTKNGELYVWGYGINGITGNRDAQKEYEPKYIMDNVDKIQINNIGTIGVLTFDNQLYVWGDNHNKQVGVMSEANQFWEPQLIMENVKQYKIGAAVSVAVTENNELYIWGKGLAAHVESQDDIESIIYEPEKIMEHVKMADANSGTAMAVTTDGKLYTWGQKDLNGREEDNIEPMVLLENIDIACFDNNAVCYAISNKGELFTWGRGDEYQLGNGRKDEFCKPSQIFSDAKYVSSGDFYSIMIDNQGKLYHWGTIWNDKNRYWDEMPNSVCLSEYYTE